MILAMGVVTTTLAQEASVDSTAQDVKIGYSRADWKTLSGAIDKVTEERNPSGIVRNHALSIPVELGYDEVQNADNALNDKEILCVLTAYDGTKLCVHYLPKSTNISYEDSRGSNHTGTVKFTAQSRSWLVKLASSVETVSEPML